MRRISALEQKIREYVNNANLLDRYFNSRPDDEWMTLCVSMNTLGDTCQALEYYEDYGIGNDYGEKYLKLYGLLQAIFLQQNSIEDYGIGNDYGEKYLKLYGLLQAIFLQQNSIRQIYQIFLGRKLSPKPDSAWTKIRDHRNLIVGHPIEKNYKTGTKRCFISRVTIQNNGFQLMIWNKEKEQKEFENVNLKTLYKKYKTDAIEYLNNIYKAQIIKWGAL